MGIPGLHNSSHKSAMHDTVMEDDIPMGPLKFANNTQRLGIGGLFHVDTEVQSIAKVSCIGQRREQPTKRVRAGISDDRQINPGYMPAWL